MVPWGMHTYTPTQSKSLTCTWPGAQVNTHAQPSQRIRARGRAVNILRSLCPQVNPLCLSSPLLGGSCSSRCCCSSVNSGPLSGTAVLVANVPLRIPSVELLLCLGVKCRAVKDNLELLYRCIGKMKIMLPLSRNTTLAVAF